jgi:hypothetical protein
MFFFSAEIVEAWITGHVTWARQEEETAIGKREGLSY